MKKLLLFILLFTLIISVCGCDTFGDDTFGVLNDEPDANGVTRVVVSTNEKRGTCLISDIGFEFGEIEKNEIIIKIPKSVENPDTFKVYTVASLGGAETKADPVTKCCISIVVKNKKFTEEEIEAINVKVYLGEAENKSCVVLLNGAEIDNKNISFINK